MEPQDGVPLNPILGQLASVGAIATPIPCLVNHIPPFPPVMRLGKPLEHLQAALRASQSSGELGEQVTTIGRQLAYFGYLSYDAAVWVRIQPPSIQLA